MDATVIGGKRNVNECNLLGTDPYADPRPLCRPYAECERVNQWPSTRRELLFCDSNNENGCLLTSSATRFGLGRADPAGASLPMTHASACLRAWPLWNMTGAASNAL